MENSSFDFLVPPPKGKSYFFSFEGLEGCGKSTQILRLQKYFEEQGYSVHTLREPGGTHFGESLRQVILHNKGQLHPMAEATLFASARAQLLYEKIIPVLEGKKQIIICDRYIDSSFAYQAFAREQGMEAIANLHRSPPLNLVPHLTFYLQIDLEDSMARQQKRGQAQDYFEKQKQTFHMRVKEGYEQLCQIFPERIVVIDGRHSPEVVERTIRKKIEDLIEQS